MADKGKPLILNVDDDDAGRYAVTRTLQQAGFEVVEAATGREALRLAEECPDLVVLDVNLPDINGFEVCRQIKANPRTAAIPVVHLSATYVGSEDRIAGLDEGADGYLTQPVEPRELVATIKAFLRLKAGEQALREAGKQWQATFDAVKDAVCLLDLDQRILRCNHAMTALTGGNPADLIGRYCWEVVHRTTEPIPECPWGRVWTSHRRERIELQWGDRWFDVTVDPVLDGHQALQGAVHVIRDITEQKRSEAALRESEAALHRSREELRTLAAGLLTAQEEERRRLSRELHDDLNQRLAMLAVDFESLEQHLPLSPQAIRAQLGSLKCRVVELSDDLRRMASQLHPSVLEHLGLVVALKSYCEELSKRERIEARLTHHNVPTQLPLDTALCLYRVVQEGLRNVARHSSSPSVTVSLEGTRDSIRLSIADLGVGFDPLSVKSRGGLGLISMEERVRLVHGHFAVHSQPGRGVRIEVRVPLPAKAAAPSA